MVSCSILGCKSRSERKDEAITFHSYPYYEAEKRKWIEVTGRVNWQPNKYSKVCSKHFSQESFVQTKKTVHLKPFSLPVKHIHEVNKSIQYTNNSKINIKVINKKHNNRLSKLQHSNSSHNQEVCQSGQVCLYVKPAEYWNTKDKTQTKNVSQSYSNKETLKTEHANNLNQKNTNEGKENISNNTLEYLQKLVKKFINNTDEEKDIYVFVVNNENDPSSEQLLYGKKSYEFAVNCLRGKLEKKTKLADERNRRVRALAVSRRRLLNRIKILENVNRELKTKNFLLQNRINQNMDVDPNPVINSKSTNMNGGSKSVINSKSSHMNGDGPINSRSSGPKPVFNSKSSHMNAVINSKSSHMNGGLEPVINSKASHINGGPESVFNSKSSHMNGDPKPTHMNGGDPINSKSSHMNGDRKLVITLKPSVTKIDNKLYLNLSTLRSDQCDDDDYL
ncbi:uncharacterized protein LOC112052071 [Bicyclus anynana]|uniref:Uncharacterized protein LOC112052071 n=1 Tax=Bicyclus anynana TaxID=110368 RepID=A0A6J1NG62_BICAN|nr:uncharacterized protein LOC112052071 [Bicyclus anynana]